MKEPEVTWYWTNALMRSLRANKEKSLFKEPVRIEGEEDKKSCPNDNDEEEATSSYAMSIANKAQSSSSKDEVNLKKVYQQRLDHFLGDNEGECEKKRAKTDDESENESANDDEIRRFRGVNEKLNEEELSDKEEENDEDEYDDDAVVK